MAQAASAEGAHDLGATRKFNSTVGSLGSAGTALAATADFNATANLDLTIKPGTDLDALALTESAQARRRKKRNPGMKWDGRFDRMSLEEYREKKWSLDACFAKTKRSGPAFTCRPALHVRQMASGSDNRLLLNTFAAYDATHRVASSYSMGLLPLCGEIERSKGPAEYKVQSTMDSRGNPMIPKHQGTTFGSEVLLVDDEVTPAPGDYDKEAFKASARIPRAPKYSMAGREAFIDQAGAAAYEPAPGEYDTNHKFCTGKDTPVEWTAQGKTEPRNPPTGSRMCVPPGPAHYKPPGGGARNNHCASHRPPAYTLPQEVRGLL